MKSMKFVKSRSAISKLVAGLITVVVVLAGVLGYVVYLYMTPPAPVKPIKIGILADNTGWLATYGYVNSMAARAAIKTINAEGGISGRPLELYVEDSETQVSVGVMRYRKLVEYYGVDFVIGAQHSGTDIAITPIAKETKTITLMCGGSQEITEEKGNRYIFRMVETPRQTFKAAASWLTKNLGKKWALVNMDYTWGWSCEEEFTRWITEYGGTVVKAIRVPSGTKDFLPYLMLIPKEAEAVQTSFLMAELVALLKDLYAIRPDMKTYVASYCVAGIATEEIPEITEGLCVVTGLPRRLEEFDTPYTRKFRELIGMDPEGKEVGNPDNILTQFTPWGIWEFMFALKKGIEETGWKSKEDAPMLIKALEGMELKESLAFPQGDGFIRAEDHQIFVSTFIEQVVNGKLKVASRIPIEETIFPPDVDYTKEPF